MTRSSVVHSSTVEESGQRFDDPILDKNRSNGKGHGMGDGSHVNLYFGWLYVLY